jgi:hypothetical protein
MLERTPSQVFPLRGCYLKPLDNFIVTVGLGRRLSVAWEVSGLHLRIAELHSIEVDLEDKTHFTPMRGMYKTVPSSPVVPCISPYLVESLLLNISLQ